MLYCIVHYTVYTMTNLIGRAIVGTDSIHEIPFLYCIVLCYGDGVACASCGIVLYCIVLCYGVGVACA